MAQSANRAASESAEREFRSTNNAIKPGTEWERVINNKNGITLLG